MDIAIASLKIAILERESRQTCQAESLVVDEKSIYEQLIAPIESQMMRSIWRVVRHPELAEDTLQDALTIIWRKRKRIRRHPNPRALILKICLNAAYDTLRMRKRLRQQEDPSLLDKFPSPSDTNVSNALERKKMEDEILKAIGRLPKKQSVAVLMRIIQDQPFDVIGQTLGCSEITARIHVSRGRARLSQWLSHLHSTPLKEASK